ncbi:formate/nitrate transporter, putative [Theileria annulata]|uniref:Formate-nitrite transporter n=1 Tax=Theileria annulata TaxID=5874 RepID=Q4UFP9_THEAN|nr:formate/nitrate transporter, putative [Theileria annulata]CAI74067.1 formate/nitrate transporter, putative [Theileria annulata]|eukprot:XP_951799.1 formate/nitrate transporter, putative [Theileria annulata]
MFEYTRQLASAKDNYERIAKEAGDKVNGNILTLFVKSLLGGWFVAIGGYAASVIASLFYEQDASNGAARAAFSLIFPGALCAILFTGSDLYTGNTMSFTFALCKKHITFLNYFLKLGISIMGNYIGAVIGALILSGGTTYFLKDVGKGAPYLLDMAIAKTNKPFWKTMFSAIGCNCFVCLAVWSFYACYDSAGAVLIVFAHIGAFAAGGLEHTIANFYLLNAALISQSGVSFLDVYYRNLIPVFLGNTIAGTMFMGLPIAFMYRETPKHPIFKDSRSDDVEIKALIV